MMLSGSRRRAASTSRDLVLAFQRALAGVAEPGRLNRFAIDTGIHQCPVGGVGRELPHRPIQMLAQRRHADAGHGYVDPHLLPRIPGRTGMKLIFTF